MALTNTVCGVEANPTIEVKKVFDYIFILFFFCVFCFIVVLGVFLFSKHIIIMN